MKRVVRCKPRRIYFDEEEDFDLGGLGSKIDEPSALEQYPFSEEELDQEDMQDKDSPQGDLPPPPLSPPPEEPSFESGFTSPPLKKRGRPRKTESTAEPTKKLPPPKSPEAEIEKIKNRKGTPLTKMIQLRLKGLTVKEIADKLGMKYNTVLVTMRNLFNLLDREKLIAFEKYRNEIYSAIEFELLDLMLDPKKKEEAKLHNIAYAFDRIYNARRLEQGKSTANIGFHALIEEIEKRREKQFEENPAMEVLELEGKNA